MEYGVVKLVYVENTLGSSQSEDSTASRPLEQSKKYS
jgi:hypothetical protein